jgi:hypothetical protein
VESTLGSLCTVENKKREVEKSKLLKVENDCGPTTITDNKQLLDNKQQKKRRTKGKHSIQIKTHRPEGIIHQKKDQLDFIESLVSKTDPRYKRACWGREASHPVQRGGACSLA